MKARPIRRNHYMNSIPEWTADAVRTTPTGKCNRVLLYYDLASGDWRVKLFDGSHMLDERPIKSSLPAAFAWLDRQGNETDESKLQRRAFGVMAYDYDLHTPRAVTVGDPNA